MVCSEDVRQGNGVVDYYCHHNPQLAGGVWKITYNCHPRQISMMSKQSHQDESPESPPETINAIASELSIFRGLTASFGNSKTFPAKL